MVHHRVIFLWIYRPIHRTVSFTVNGDDLENTKTNISKFMVNDAVLEHVF